MSNTNSIRRISPLGFRVVVKIEKEIQTTDGGLYLPEGTKEKLAETILAEVIEVATAIDDSMDEEPTNVSGVPLGARVLVRKNAGVKIPWDESLRIIETQEVLAIVDEITVT